jgi:hypothetical protein
MRVSWLLSRLGERLDPPDRGWSGDVAQALAFDERPELLQDIGLDLPDSLPRDLEYETDLVSVCG